MGKLASLYMTVFFYKIFLIFFLNFWRKTLSTKYLRIKYLILLKNLVRIVFFDFLGMYVIQIDKLKLPDAFINLKIELSVKLNTVFNVHVWYLQIFTF